MRNVVGSNAEIGEIGRYFSSAGGTLIAAAGRGQGGGGGCSTPHRKGVGARGIPLRVGNWVPNKQ